MHTEELHDNYLQAFLFAVKPESRGFDTGFFVCIWIEQLNPKTLGTQNRAATEKLSFPANKSYLVFTRNPKTLKIFFLM